MNYVLLIANAPDAWDDTDTRPPDGTDDGVISDWGVYTRALQAAGVLVAGHALHGASDATTDRMRRGERLLTDGPFADTEEPGSTAPGPVDSPHAASATTKSVTGSSRWTMRTASRRNQRPARVVAQQ